MNIFQQMRLYIQKKTVERMYSQGLTTKRNPRGWTRKNRLTYCPRCQQWQPHTAITLCAICYCEIPELREKWDERTNRKQDR